MEGTGWMNKCSKLVHLLVTDQIDAAKEVAYDYYLMNNMRPLVDKAIAKEESKGKGRAHAQALVVSSRSQAIGARTA